MGGRGWLRLSHLLAVVIVVGFATFQTSAEAGDPPLPAAADLILDVDGPAVAEPLDDLPQEMTAGAAFVIDDIEASDSDPDPDEELGRPTGFITSRPMLRHGRLVVAPTIVGHLVAAVSPAAALVATRAPRGPPCR
ncbi:MAG: hypothetical protein KC731_31345 [Myxococcales bacterium]|nr:hypothetical protein [Myxococcales bacterium]